jgi:hypothetical protein
MLGSVVRGQRSEIRGRAAGGRETIIGGDMSDRRDRVLLVGLGAVVCPALVLGGLALLYMTHLPRALTFMPFVLPLALSQRLGVFVHACAAVAAACGVAAVLLIQALTTEPAVGLRQHSFPYHMSIFFPNPGTREPLFSRDAFNQRQILIFALLPRTCHLCRAFRRTLLVVVAHWLTAATDRDQMLRLGLGFIALVMMLPVSNFVCRLIPVFQGIRFSRRLLAPATLILCILAIFLWRDVRRRSRRAGRCSYKGRLA